MAARLSQEEFVTRLVGLHGDAYDFSETVFTRMVDKVVVICPAHGKWLAFPQNLLRGHGCRKCSSEVASVRNRDEAGFIENSKKTFPGKFSYDNMVYINSKTPTTITCARHGGIEIIPVAHLGSNTGCPHCSMEDGWQGGKITQEEFLKRFKAAHGDTYDYSLVQTDGIYNKVRIICPIHGEFLQTPSGHMQGKGCSKCKGDKISKARTKDTAYFLERARAAHGDYYDYSLVEYVKGRKSVEIVCPVHGVFKQEATGHMMGRGCEKCGRDSTTEKQRSNLEDFVEKAVVVHGDKYGYSEAKYTNATTHLSINCKACGSTFWQTPNNHLRGRSCPSCSKSGFRQDLPGVFYILQSDDYVKVGITNLTAQSRAADINKTTTQRFKVVKEYSGSGRECNTCETTMLRWLRGEYKSPSTRFDGWSECFSGVSVQDVLNKAEEVFGG